MNLDQQHWFANQWNFSCYLREGIQFNAMCSRGLMG